MAEEIIQARVWTKVDTLENWNANPLLLGPGEMALVTTPSGVPMNMKWGDKTTRKRFSDLPFAIAYDQGQFVAVTGTVLPASDGTVHYSLVGEGTYTRAGQSDVVVPTGKMGVIVDDGTTWVLSSTVELPSVSVLNDYGSSTDEAISQAKATETNTKVTDVTQTLSESIETNITFTLQGGSYNTTSGVFVPGANWISTPILNIPENTDKINLSGYGMFTTAQRDRILWFSPTAFLPPVQSSGSGVSFETTPPVGATRFAIQVDGGSGVGSDPANSPYNQSFKIVAKSVVQESTFLKGERVRGRIETEQLETIEADIQDLKNGGGSGSAVAIPFAYPSNFTFRPYPIVREFDQYRFEGYKGIEDGWIATDKEVITPYYVEPINGRDSNSGNRTSPYQTIRGAVDKGARWIILMNCNKFYPRNSNFSLLTLPSFTEGLIIEAEEGANVVLANSDRSDVYTWTNDGGGIYKASRSQVSAVIDTSRTNSRGNFVSLTKRATLADLQAQPDGFFADSTSVYIKHDKTPTTEFEICLSVLQKIVSNGQKYIYLKGIKFYTNSGVAGIEINNNLTTQFDTKVFLKDVQANENKISNGIAINNIKEAVLENCGGYGHGLDSLNYHTEVAGYSKMKVIEINGFGGDNGIGTTQLSSNGSTAHDGISIIRMGGSFEMCMGPVIADVSVNGKSLNFNVVAKDTVLDSGACFQNSGVNNEMWLYGCSAYNSTSGKFSVRSHSSGIAYIGPYNRLIGDKSGDVREIL